MAAAGTEEAPHDLAGVVDPEGLSGASAGDIELREGGAVEDKAVEAAGIAEIPHDLAGVVDPEGLSVASAGDIELREGGAVEEKAVEEAAGIEELPHDLGGVVDPEGVSAASAGEGDIELREGVGLWQGRPRRRQDQDQPQEWNHRIVSHCVLLVNVFLSTKLSWLPCQASVSHSG